MLFWMICPLPKRMISKFHTIHQDSTNNILDHQNQKLLKKTSQNRQQNRT